MAPLNTKESQNKENQNKENQNKEHQNKEHQNKEHQKNTNKGEQDNGLFLLEVLIDKIIFVKSPCFSDKDFRTCVNVSCFSVEPLEICDDDPAACVAKSGGPFVKTFNNGKSCLFSLKKEEIASAMSKFPISVVVYKSLPCGCLPTKIVMGEATIDMTKEFVQARNKYLKDPTCVSYQALKDNFRFMGQDGNQTGEIVMYLRISCFGKLIVTKFQSTGGQLTLGAGHSGLNDRSCNPPRESQTFDEPCVCGMGRYAKDGGSSGGICKAGGRGGGYGTCPPAVDPYNSMPCAEPDDPCYCTGSKRPHQPPLACRNTEAYCLHVPKGTPLLRLPLYQDLAEERKQQIKASVKEVKERQSIQKPQKPEQDQTNPYTTDLKIILGHRQLPQSTITESSSCSLSSRSTNTSNKQNISYTNTDSELESSSDQYNCSKEHVYGTEMAVYMSFFKSNSQKTSGTQATASVNKCLQVPCSIYSQEASCTSSNASTCRDIRNNQYQEVYFFGKKWGMGSSDSNNKKQVSNKSVSSKTENKHQSTSAEAENRNQSIQMNAKVQKTDNKHQPTSAAAENKNQSQTNIKAQKTDNKHQSTSAAAENKNPKAQRSSTSTAENKNPKAHRSSTSTAENKNPKAHRSSTSTAENKNPKAQRSSTSTAATSKGRNSVNINAPSNASDGEPSGDITCTISHIKIGPKDQCPALTACIGPACVLGSPQEDKAPVKVTNITNPRRGVFELVIRRMVGAPLAKNELMLEWTPPPCRAPPCGGPTSVFCYPSGCKTSKCGMVMCRPSTGKPKCCSKKWCRKQCGPIPIKCDPDPCRIRCRKCCRPSCSGRPCRFINPGCRPCPPLPCMLSPCLPSACIAMPCLPLPCTQMPCPALRCRRCPPLPCTQAPCCLEQPCRSSPCLRLCPVGRRRHTRRIRSHPRMKAHRKVVSPCLNRSTACPVVRCRSLPCSSPCGLPCALPCGADPCCPVRSPPCKPVCCGSSTCC